MSYNPKVHSQVQGVKKIQRAITIFLVDIRMYKRALHLEESDIILFRYEKLGPDSRPEVEFESSGLLINKY